jgi:hypothetical protein
MVGLLPPDRGEASTRMPLALESDLNARLSSTRFVLRVIVDAQDQKTRYEIHEADQTVRAVGPDGRKTVYATTGERRLFAEVDRKSGRLEFRYGEEV